ncbi:TonB family protein [Arcobacter sp. s6]|uniref:TonB family protein n=1 Tax=Arcobacter sp. s6 TaxID=3230363 RepID=UPI0034A02C80
MENKKSLLIIFTLIISAHLLLFANIVVEEKIVVAQNKPASTISKINLKNVVIKKPEPKVEPVVEPIVEKIIEKPLPETKSKNIVKQEKKKEVKKDERKFFEKVEKTEEVKVEQRAEAIVQEIASKEVIKQENTIDPSQIEALENEYLSKLRYVIEKNKIYPNAAKRLNQMGKVHVSFIISKDGEIKDIKIIKDSNYKRLNEAALEILGKINRFEPIPEKLNKNSWEITVPIIYEITRS